MSLSSLVHPVLCPFFVIKLLLDLCKQAVAEVYDYFKEKSWYAE